MKKLVTLLAASLAIMGLAVPAKAATDPCAAFPNPVYVTDSDILWTSTSAREVICITGSNDSVTLISNTDPAAGDVVFIMGDSDIVSGSDTDSEQVYVESGSDNQANMGWGASEAGQIDDYVVIMPPSADTSIHGGRGNDVIQDYSGDVEVSGGRGNDSLSTDSTNETGNVGLDGGPGNDLLVNNTQAELVWLTGDDGRDRLIDQVHGTPATDTAVLDGGKGDDHIRVRNYFVQVLGGTGYDVCRVQKNIFLVHCETVI